MPDTLPVSSPSPEVLTSDFAGKFAKQLDSLGQALPEVEKTRVQIENGGLLLAQEFGLRSEILNNEDKLAYFAALAQRNGSLEERKSEMGVSAYAAEKEFIFDAMSMLAMEDSEHHGSVKDMLGDEEGGPNAEATKATYDKYTDTDATQRLTEAIQGGALDNVKQRLGITDDNEDAYQVRVLRIKDGGMIPYPEVQYDDNNPSAYNDAMDLHYQYVTELTDNLESFKHDLGAEGDLPTAWKTTIGGARTLVLARTTAENIINPDSQRDQYQVERDRAFTEHEYTHTQGGYAPEGAHWLFGMALEERRAELFSGDRLNYLDVKNAFNFIGAIAGHNVTDMIASNPKGGSGADIFMSLASKVGMQRALEMSLVLPGEYKNRVGGIPVNVDRYLGGLNGVTERIASDQIAAGHEVSMHARIKREAERIASRFAGDNFKSFLHRVGEPSQMDLPFMAKSYRDAVYAQT